MRIAIIGGADYLPEKLEDFLYALHSKYPDAVIVTGTAAGKNLYEEDNDGKKIKVGSQPSAERAAYALLTGLGHEVIIPELRGKTAEWFSSIMSAADIQLGCILSGEFELYRDDNGALQHRNTTPRADVIVTVGNPDSARAKYAADHWKRMDSWREKENIRPFHNVAAPIKEKKTTTRRPKKKVEQTEQITA